MEQVDMLQYVPSCIAHLRLRHGVTGPHSSILRPGCNPVFSAELSPYHCGSAARRSSDFPWDRQLYPLTLPVSEAVQKVHQFS